MKSVEMLLACLVTVARCRSVPRSLSKTRCSQLCVFDLRAHLRVVKAISAVSRRECLRDDEIYACFSACTETRFVKLSRVLPKVWLAARARAGRWCGRAWPSFWSVVRPFTRESECRVPLLLLPCVTSNCEPGQHPGPQWTDARTALAIVTSSSLASFFIFANYCVGSSTRLEPEFSKVDANVEVVCCSMFDLIAVPSYLVSVLGPLLVALVAA